MKWYGYAAAAWSAAYGLLGLYWATAGMTGAFPFGRADPDWEPGQSLLGDAQPHLTGWITAALGLVGAVVGVLMARRAERGRPFLIGFGWVAAILLTVVVQDSRVLMVVAYSPLLAVWAFTGIPGGQSMSEILPWSRVNLLIVVVGGLLWAATALAYQGNVWRGRWTTPSVARRWGRWAVYVAAFIPAVYDISRVAWAAGYPLGITRDFWNFLDQSGLKWGGLFLSAMGLGGAILTLGLIQRWGEVFPRWIWFKAGKRVPPMLAVVPASIVSVIVLSAGLMFWRLRFVHGFAPADMWATWAPSLLWPLWGIALAAATLAYYLRRRTPTKPDDRKEPDDRTPMEPDDREPGGRAPIKSDR